MISPASVFAPDGIIKCPLAIHVLDIESSVVQRHHFLYVPTDSDAQCFRPCKRVLYCRDDTNQVLYAAENCKISRKNYSKKVTHLCEILQHSSNLLYSNDSLPKINVKPLYSSTRELSGGLTFPLVLVQVVIGYTTLRAVCQLKSQPMDNTCN